MRWVALVVALALPAYAEDAPRIVRLDPGQPAPWAGLLLTDDQAILAAQRLVECRTERDELKKAVALHPLAIAAIVVGSVIVGAAVGVGVTVASNAPPVK